MIPSKFYRSTTPGSVPTALPEGQLAFNEADGIVFWRDATSGAVKASPKLASLVTLSDTLAAASVPTAAAISAAVATAVANLVASAPGALDTLKELADALGDDPNYAATTAAALANRLRVDVAQGLTAAQRAQAQANLGVALSSVRQTVQCGPASGGVPSFLPPSSSGLAIATQNVGTGANALIISAAQGFNAGGSVDYLLQLTANVAWSGLPANATVYLGLNTQTGAPVFTTTPPAYQFGGPPSSANSTYTFDYQAMTMYVGNGSGATPVPVVFVGEAVTNASAVASAVAYAFNGYYTSGSITPIPGTAVRTLKNSNIGIPNGLATIKLVNVNGEAGFVPGDTTVPFVTDASNLASLASTLYRRNACGFTTSYSAYPLYINDANGNLFGATSTNWAYVLEARRPFR